MRRIGAALSLLALASLLGAPPSALAAPPWARDGRLQLAGGPPPWAPAHGYRHKYKHRHHHHHDDADDEVAYLGELPDLGIELGHCNRAALGAILGGITGGVIGSQLGKGSRRTAATIGGAIIGVIVGGAVGRSMDRVDQACVGQALEYAETGQTVAWTHPDGGQYEVTPYRTFQQPSGRYCREYLTEASIGGGRQQLYGTACRQPDGSWERVS